MSDPNAPISREQFQKLFENFREIKHDINNTLAVIMALSELAQRNPAHFEKLAKAVLTRGPNVVQQLQDFQTAMGATLKGEAAGDQPPTPTSGVF